MAAVLPLALVSERELKPRRTFAGINMMFKQHIAAKWTNQLLCSAS